MARLQGKVALVTGSAKGIGAAIAKRLAEEGAKVVLNYAGSQAAAEKVVGGITGAGGQAVAVQADVTKAADVARLFAEAKKAFGPVDILVNNAGRYEFVALAAIEEGHFRKMFDTNVLGLLYASQAAAQQFPAGTGVIVNISSTVALTPAPGGSVYSATKAAVDNITRALALELAPKVRVVGVAPGLTQTEGLAEAEMGPEMQAWAVSRTPVGRMGQPEDVANAVAFAASAEASFISGETIQVGGGIRF